MRSALLVFCVAGIAAAQSADEIMAKVAESQSRAEAARSGFVYRQQVMVRMLRSNGKLAREEDREYTVTPQPDGVEREMVHFTGKYGVGGKEFAISDPGEHYKDTDIDADLAKSLADSFGGDDKTHDGVNSDLFPLTADKQKGYRFKLTGRGEYRGHQVYKVSFEPSGDTHWAGEALIDTKDFAPVLITTHLAHGVPLVVKTVLGTNLQQIGFKVQYEKFEGGLWFPVGYSGEMKVKLLFLYSRTIGMSVVNSGFQKVDVQSTVTFEKQ